MRRRFAWAAAFCVLAASATAVHAITDEEGSGIADEEGSVRVRKNHARTLGQALAIQERDCVAEDASPG